MATGKIKCCSLCLFLAGAILATFTRCGQSPHAATAPSEREYAGTSAIVPVPTTQTRRKEFSEAFKARHAKLYAEHARLIGIRDSMLVKTFSGHTDGVCSVQFSPDGKLLASGSADKTVRIWDVATGKELHKLEGHRGIIFAVAFSSDSKYLVSAGWDEQAIAWNVQTGDIEGVWPLPGFAEHAAFLPGGNQFVVTSNDQLSLYQIGQDKVLCEMDADDTILAMAVTRDGRVVTGDKAGEVILWDPLAGRRVMSRSRPDADIHKKNWIDSVYPLRDGSMLVADSERTWRWDLHSGKMAEILRRANGNEVAIDSDQAFIYSYGNEVGIAEASNGMHWNWLAEGLVHSIAVSPSGKLLALGIGGDFTDQTWHSTSAGILQVYSISKMRELCREHAVEQVGKDLPQLVPTTPAKNQWK